MFGIQASELFARASTPSTPPPFTFTPSQVFDGNDGAWSSFVIRVGTPEQYFRVLPSLSSPTIYVPLPLNCSSSHVSNCGNARGVEPFKSPSTATSTTPSQIEAGGTCSANKSPFCGNCVSIGGKCTTGPCAGQFCCGDVPGACNSAGCNGVSGLCTQAYIGCPCTGDDYDAASAPKDPGAASPAAALGFWGNDSSSWDATGNYTLFPDNSHFSGFAATGNGSFGQDIVGLGPTPDAGLSLTQKSLVAGAPIGPFFTGSLGLQPSNSSRFDKSAPSLLMLLKEEGLIPSLSYGYTAGAVYRKQGVLGSLTLGGYDTSRFLPNALSFPITTPSTTPKLLATLRSITATNTLEVNTTLLHSPISIAIDTSSPFLALPAAACPLFAAAFGLTHNARANLYRLNASVHGELRTANPSLKFQFGLSGGGAEVVNISAPYQAFDLQTTAPITANGTNYFPLRCSNDAAQFSLGRAFLQEAYITADFESGNFSISQADFSGKESNVVPINHAPASSASARDGNPTASGAAGLSKGTIAGIAVGASIAALLIFAVLLFLYRCHRHNQADSKMISELGHADAKESWPSSPATSPTERTEVGSPYQVFEQREGAYASAHASRRAEMGGGDLGSPPAYGSLSKAHQRANQELPGDVAVVEMAQERSARGSVDMGEKRRERESKRHVFELAGDGARRGK